MDHLIYPKQRRLWDRQTGLLRRFQIDCKIKLHRLLNG